MEYSYRTPFDLPIRDKTASGIHVENEFLTGLYEKIFTQHPIIIAPLHAYYMEAKRQGFPNHIMESVPEKKLSHDQATAYRYLLYTFYTEQVGRYEIPLSTDNHPRDVIWDELLRKRSLPFYKRWFLYGAAWASLNIGYRLSKETTYQAVFTAFGYTIQRKLSGELLWILRYETIKNSPGLSNYAETLRSIILKGAERRFGGVAGMVFTYFYNDPNHPIVRNWNYEL